MKTLYLAASNPLHSITVPTKLAYVVILVILGIVAFKNLFGTELGLLIIGLVMGALLPGFFAAFGTPVGKVTGSADLGKAGAALYPTVVFGAIIIATVVFAVRERRRNG